MTDKKKKLYVFAEVFLAAEEAGWMTSISAVVEVELLTVTDLIITDQHSSFRIMYRDAELQSSKDDIVVRIRKERVVERPQGRKIPSREISWRKNLASVFGKGVGIHVFVRPIYSLSIVLSKGAGIMPCRAAPRWTPEIRLFEV